MNKQILLTVLLILAFPADAFCQIVPDSSFGNKSSIIIKNQSINGKILDLITGGRKSGPFLFHSFDRFNISSRKGAAFLPSKNIQTIVSRVTGQRSKLDGFLGIQGSQNLIFVNPHGIQLGGRFQSGISGAFTLSTAAKLRFGKTDFLNTDDKLFLFSNKPNDAISFDFQDSKKGEILVKNSPKNIVDNVFIGFVPIPVFSEDIPQGLTSFSGKNLNLLAGSIRLNGGIINSFSGDVNIYAVRNGSLKLDTQSKVISNQTKRYGDVTLTNLSNVISFSEDDSTISLFGRNVKLTNGSFVSSFSNNPSQTQKGDINISAELFSMSGLSDPSSIGLDGLIRSGILSNAEFGLGSDIEISATNAVFDNAAGILSRANNNATGGDIKVNVTNTLSALGNVKSQGAFSGIGSLAYSRSKGGDIGVNSNSIELKDSSSIQTYAFDHANAGNITVSARESLRLRGVNSIFPLASQIQTYSFSNFPAGSVDVSAQDILIRDGGGIGSSTRQSDTGTVTVTARSIDLSGSISDTVSRSRIFSSVQEQDPRVAELFVPTGVLGSDNRVLEGDAASLTVKTDVLRISNDAEISVRNDGVGNAGNLVVIASRVDVSNGAQITASTLSGNGGNILIDANSLTVDNASISSSSQGSGQGGNIDISTSFAAFIDKAVVEANAENALAGNIKFTTDVAFASPNTKFTTTSTLGPQFDGTIELDVQDSQPIQTVRLSSLRRVDTDVSKICGYDGNRLSVTSNAQIQEIAENPELLTAWNIREIDNQLKGKRFRDIETGEVKPLRPVLAIEYFDNGKFRSIYSPSDSKYVLNLLSSLQEKCSKLRST